ncbi:hypothetical protein HWV62_23426 [Athelia sp. TMB]|nr:hypothetical protein HWV62_23426 [Athelia sp. TMB]
MKRTNERDAVNPILKKSKPNIADIGTDDASSKVKRYEVCSNDFDQDVNINKQRPTVKKKSVVLSDNQNGGDESTEGIVENIEETSNPTESLDGDSKANSEVTDNGQSMPLAMDTSQDLGSGKTFTTAQQDNETGSQIGHKPAITKKVRLIVTSDDDSVVTLESDKESTSPNDDLRMEAGKQRVDRVEGTTGNEYERVVIPVTGHLRGVEKSGPEDDGEGGSTDGMLLHRAGSKSSSSTSSAHQSKWKQPPTSGKRIVMKDVLAVHESKALLWFSPNPGSNQPVNLSIVPITEGTCKRAHALLTKLCNPPAAAVQSSLDEIQFSRFMPINPETAEREFFHGCYDATESFDKDLVTMSHLSTNELKKFDIVLVAAKIIRWRTDRADPKDRAGASSYMWKTWRAKFELQTVSLLRRHTPEVKVIPEVSEDQESRFL